ncbi:hypothetical protein KJ671_03240 [Patescibacteria group bacterium]|nr:hypothetical protein [Patescibacteria group bacterium]
MCGIHIDRRGFTQTETQTYAETILIIFLFYNPPLPGRAGTDEYGTSPPLNDKYGTSPPLNDKYGTSPPLNDKYGTSILPTSRYFFIITRNSELGTRRWGLGQGLATRD